MTRSHATWALAIASWLGSCQPSVLCDPGQKAVAGGCYPDESKRDAGNEDALDASLDASSDAESADASSCPGERFEGFKQSCTRAADCGCHAPDCATAPLGYCTKFNCDPDDEDACPPDWTCLAIPAGSSPDPSITHLCLAPL